MRTYALLLACVLVGTQRPASPLLNPDGPEFQRAAAARTVVRLETSRGDIVVEVMRDWAPKGADRFVSLVRAGYYDDTRFFRAIKDRWVQFGISGDPTIAKAWRQRTLPDDPFKESNVRGTIAFAFAVPNGRTTQVFINMQDNSAAHDKEPFVPFGRVTRGMEIADVLNTEYGESSGGGIRAGHQDPLFDEGNVFLDRQFPKLDRITRASIVSEDAPGALVHRQPRPITRPRSNAASR